MVRAAMFVALLAAGATGLSAQSPSASPTPPAVAFEVASIKPASGDTARQGMPSPDRFHASDFTLRALIGYAYAMDEFRVLGGPAWVGSERWEVSARASRAPSRAEMRMMVQQLIAGRYGLRTHVERRDLPTYSLVLARGDGQLGPNMQPAAVDCEPFRGEPRTAAGFDDAGDLRRPCGTTTSRWGGGVHTMSYTAWSTTRLAELLAAVVGRVVVDETRLTGSFDIELTYENEELRRRFPGPGLPREAPDLFTALQEQLGLRLVPSRAPVDVLVIDAVERPTPN